MKKDYTKHLRDAAYGSLGRPMDVTWIDSMFDAHGKDENAKFSMLLRAFAWAGGDNDKLKAIHTAFETGGWEAVQKLIDDE